jgi:hypothetical protein
MTDRLTAAIAAAVAAGTHHTLCVPPVDVPLAERLVDLAGGASHITVAGHPWLPVQHGRPGQAGPWYLIDNTLAWREDGLSRWHPAPG